MTYEYFLNEVDKMCAEYPAFRRGQAMFNVLAMLDYKLADAVRGATIDPFHSDSKIELFTKWLVTNLNYESCPACDNVGIVADHSGDALQCEWCWTNPNSIFYQVNRLWEKESA